MPVDVTYHLKIGEQIADSNQRDSHRQLLALAVELGMDGAGTRCMVELADPEYTTPTPGDAFIVELGGVYSKARVFTGVVDTVETTSHSQRIFGADGLLKLARMDVETSYENVSVDFIVKDLLKQAKVDSGTVEKGPKLPSLTLFRGPRAFGHIQRLARLCGTDLFTDGMGKAHFAGPETKGQTHAFQYGEDVMELQLKEISPASNGVEVWGEGAASSKGAQKYYWLPTDLSGTLSKAVLGNNGSVLTGKSGHFPLHVCAGALRSRQATDAVAKAMVNAKASRCVQGSLKVFCAPAVTPGDRITVTDLPDHHGAADIFNKKMSVRVRRVRHFLDTRMGCITRMDV